mmetsp:Transcript_46370/g.87036  ORF Transcript_46370/g.87036 Transcript_46370/m.87036 type:complete len:369 (+) Transcript_46370:90-1196(+)
MLFLGNESAAALATIILIFTGICILLWRRGPCVMLSAITFVQALVATQLNMKLLTSAPFSYRFPALVTAMHFFCVLCVSTLYWIYMGDWKKCLPSSMGNYSRYITTILPIALSNPLCVVFNNKSLVYLGAGTCAIIGTLSPVTVTLLSVVLGRVLSPMAWIGILVAFLGAMVVAHGEVNDLRTNAGDSVVLLTGSLFALTSVLLRSVKVVLSDNLLAPAFYLAKEDAAAKAPLNMSPMHIYALQAPLCLVTSLTFAFTTESFSDAWNQLTLPVACMIFLTCVSATVLNFAGMFSLRDLGASSQQIIGKVNTVCVAVLSMGFLGEQLPGLVVLGTVIVFLGIAIFEHSAHCEQRQGLGFKPMELMFCRN